MDKNYLKILFGIYEKKVKFLIIIIFLFLINNYSYPFGDIYLLKNTHLISRRIRSSSSIREVLTGIGGRIRQARLAHGWSQEELARQLTEELRERGLLEEGEQIPPSQISRWENEVKFPLPEKLPVLAEVLGLDVYVLISGKEKDRILSEVGGIAERIGKRILISRLVHGWSQEELARQLTEELKERGLLEEGEQIFGDRISRWESEFNLPLPERLPVLAEVLGLDVYVLISGKFKESLPDLPHIGLRIKVARLANGLTQTELGEKVGVSRQTINYWENGETIPSQENIEKLVQALNLGIYLLTGKKGGN